MTQAPGETTSPALALANSRRRSGRGMIDELDTPERLAAWLREHGLVTAKTRVAATEHERFRALRDAVRSLLQAVVDEGAPPAKAVRLINDAGMSAPRAVQLDWSGTGATGHAVFVSDDALDAAAGEIAADAIDLVTGDRAGALLGCSGPGCVRFLVKDHPRRQWCSSACGQRIRAARYYHRHR